MQVLLLRRNKLEYTFNFLRKFRISNFFSTNSKNMIYKYKLPMVSTSTNINHMKKNIGASPTESNASPKVVLDMELVKAMAARRIASLYVFTFVVNEIILYQRTVKSWLNYLNSRTNHKPSRIAEGVYSGKNKQNLGRNLVQKKSANLAECREEYVFTNYFATVSSCVFPHFCIFLCTLN